MTQRFTYATQHLSTPTWESAALVFVFFLPPHFFFLLLLFGRVFCARIVCPWTTERTISRLIFSVVLEWLRFFILCEESEIKRKSRIICWSVNFYVCVCDSIGKRKLFFTLKLKWSNLKDEIHIQNIENMNSICCTSFEQPVWKHQPPKFTTAKLELKLLWACEWQLTRERATTDRIFI